MTCRAVGEVEEVGRRLQAGDLQWRPGPALTLTVEGDEAVMGWDRQVRPKARGETRQATWAMGPRGTASSGSAYPQSTPPAALSGQSQTAPSTTFAAGVTRPATSRPAHAAFSTNGSRRPNFSARSRRPRGR